MGEDGELSMRENLLYPMLSENKKESEKKENNNQTSVTKAARMRGGGGVPDATATRNDRQAWEVRERRGVAVALLA